MSLDSMQQGEVQASASWVRKSRERVACHWYIICQLLAVGRVSAGSYLFNLLRHYRVYKRETHNNYHTLTLSSLSVTERSSSTSSVSLPSSSSSSVSLCEPDQQNQPVQPVLYVLFVLPRYLRYSRALPHRAVQLKVLLPALTLHAPQTTSQRPGRRIEQINGRAATD